MNIETHNTSMKQNQWNFNSNFDFFFAFLLTYLDTFCHQEFCWLIFENDQDTSVAELFRFLLCTCSQFNFLFWECPNLKKFVFFRQGQVAAVQMMRMYWNELVEIRSNVETMPQGDLKFKNICYSSVKYKVLNLPKIIKSAPK